MLQPTFSRHYNAGKSWRRRPFSITKLQQTRTALAAATWVRTERDPASIVSPGQAKKILYILCELTAVVQDGALRAEFGYQLYIVCLPRKQPVVLVRGYSVQQCGMERYCASYIVAPYLSTASLGDLKSGEQETTWYLERNEYSNDDGVSENTSSFQRPKLLWSSSVFCLRLMSMQQHWKDIAYYLCLWEILMVLIIASERALSLHTESMRQ